MGDDEPYKDENRLRELYVDQRLTQEQVAEKLDCAESTVSFWLQRHDIETRDISDYEKDVDYHPDKTPWRNEELLRELYVGKQLTQREIAEKFDCAQKTIHDWLKRHGIETRGRDANVYPAPRTCAPGHSDPGYEKIQHKCGGHQNHVFHHRLLAVAEYGLDKVNGKVVHHKNKIPWDNRPDNIELMDNKKHSLMHNSEDYDD